MTSTEEKKAAPREDVNPSEPGRTPGKAEGDREDIERSLRDDDQRKPPGSKMKGTTVPSAPMP